MSVVWVRLHMAFAQVDPALVFFPSLFFAHPAFLRDTHFRNEKNEVLKACLVLVIALE